MSGWPWPLDGVQHWFEDLWNNVLSAPFNAANYILNQLTSSFQNIINYIGSNIGYIVDNVGSIINNSINYIYSQLNYIYTNISNFIGNAINNLTYIVKNIYTNIANFVNSGLSGLRYFVQNVYTNISNFIQSSFKNMEYFLNNLSKNIFNTLNNIHKFIAANINYLNNQLSNTVQFLNNAINNGINSISNIIDGITTNISHQLSNIFSALPANIGKTFQDILKNLIVNPLTEILSQVNNIFRNIVSQFARLIDMLFHSHSPLSPEEANTLVGSYLENMDHYFGALVGAQIAVEALSLGQIDISLQNIWSHPLVSGAKSIADRMHTAWFDILYTPLLRRYFYKNETPLIPRSDDLISMRWRGLIDEDTFYNYMAENGYNREWASKLWDLSKRIPGASDLITFVVREVIPPEDFYKYMMQVGFEEKWSKYYWEAHWRLPSFENIRDAFWRGIISLDEFKKYIVWHDYKPEPRPGISKSDLEIMSSLSYELPGKIDARWMYEWNVIDGDVLKTLLKYTGLHPDWIENVAKTYMINILRDDYGRIRSSLERLYEDGWINEDNLREGLKELNFRPEVIDAIVKWAKYERQYKMLDMRKDILLELYEKNRLDKDALIKGLVSLGMDEDMARLIADLKEAQLMEEAPA